MIVKEGKIIDAKTGKIKDAKTGKIIDGKIGKIINGKMGNDINTPSDVYYIENMGDCLFPLLPTSDKELYITYVALKAISTFNIPDTPETTLSIDVKNRKIDLLLDGWEFRAYFGIRLRTTGIKLLRTSYAGMTNKDLQTSINYMKGIQKNLQLVEDILKADNNRPLSDYPYIPKYNEDGWK